MSAQNPPPPPPPPADDAPDPPEAPPAPPLPPAAPMLQYDAPGPYAPPPAPNLPGIGGTGAGSPPRAPSGDPSPAPAGPPQRDGLSAGEWVGISIGAVVFAGVLIAAGGATVLMLTMGALFFEPFSRGMTTVEGPTIIEEPLPRAPETPDGPGYDPPPFEPDLLALPLENGADFAAGPYWSVPIAEGWDIVQFDVDGVNHFVHPQSSCEFRTFQGFGDPGETYVDDREASVDALSIVLAQGLPWNAVAEVPEPSSLGSMYLDSNRYVDVEMLWYYTGYESENGMRERDILVRQFTPDNIVLYAEVDCPVGAEQTFDILDNLAITDL